MFLYSLVIKLLSGGIKIAAWFHHKKAALLIKGHKGLMDKLQSVAHDRPLLWMHCASLGEFEQGRPVMEAIRVQYPRYRILLTFFSPSGYENCQHYRGADYISYLPWDTSENAEKFVDTVRPSLVFFVKYEFWPHYTRVISKRKIPLISFSGIFRPEQIFFRFYGASMRNVLKRFDHFFVQNESSRQLLNSIGINQITISGDTRFDRVQKLMDNKDDILIAAAFKANAPMMVIGSCWPQDMEVLIPFINKNKNLKFIIAPHEISEPFMLSIEEAITRNTLRYSKAHAPFHQLEVLIVDQIGLLSRLYRYGEYAYIGGGFGSGLHNILEAACYGIPVFFGNKKFRKFQEAIDLIKRNGAFSVGSYGDLQKRFDALHTNQEKWSEAGRSCVDYVRSNTGSTEKIVKGCQPYLS